MARVPEEKEEEDDGERDDLSISNTLVNRGRWSQYGGSVMPLSFKAVGVGIPVTIWDSNGFVGSGKFGSQKYSNIAQNSCSVIPSNPSARKPSVISGRSAA